MQPKITYLVSRNLIYIFAPHLTLARLANEHKYVVLGLCNSSNNVALGLYCLQKEIGIFPYSENIAHGGIRHEIHWKINDMLFSYIHVNVLVASKAIQMLLNWTYSNIYYFIPISWT